MDEKSLIFTRVLEEIKENKARRERGEIVNIPFPFPKFSAHVPGIQKGRYIGVTANQKVGKTKLADYIFLYSTFKFWQKNRDKIKLKIFYFTLEMSKEEKVKEAISHFLYTETKGRIRKSPDKINSQFGDYILDGTTLKEIESLRILFEEFEEIVEFVDNIKNPFGIYKHVRSYAEANGKYVYKTVKTRDEEGNEESIKVEDYYIPDHPNEYVIIITDHVSLLQNENGGNDPKATMDKFSKDYCLKMRDRWKYIPVNVQQQAQAQEGVENKKAGKLQPSVDGLGESKIIGRDYDILIGLFSPFRHRIENYNGYNIFNPMTGEGLQEMYRELSVIANRRGQMVSTDLYFDGSVNYFKELPSPGSRDLQELYKKLNGQ